MLRRTFIADMVASLAALILPAAAKSVEPSRRSSKAEWTTVGAPSGANIYILSWSWGYVTLFRNGSASDEWWVHVRDEKAGPLITTDVEEAKRWAEAWTLEMIQSGIHIGD